MGITRAQIARQLLAQGGMPMKEIKGQNHMLAYITPNEANKLVRLGGQETMTPEGIPAYPEYDNYGYSNQADFDQGNYAASSDPTVSGYADRNMSDEDRKALSYAVKPTPKKTFAQKVVDSIKNVSNFTPFGIARKGLGFLFDKFQNLRGFNPNGTRRTQKQFNDARRKRQRQNRISNIMGRDAPFTKMTLENLRNLGYTGPLDGLLGSTNITRSGTTDDVYPDRVEGIVSQAPTFTDAMAKLNLELGVPRDEVFLSAKDFIDPSKTIGSEDLGTIQQNIKDATGYDATLAKNYTKEDMEKLGAKDRTILGANDQLDALQEYYNAVQTLSGAGSKFAPNNLSKARDFITSQSAKPMGMGSFGIDMSLVPQDFLQNLQDLQPLNPDGTENLQQQKSPFELFGK